MEERHQEAIQWRSAARKRGTKFKKKKPIPSTKKKQKNHLHRLGEHSTHYSDQTFTSMMRQHLNMSSQLSPKVSYYTPSPHVSTINHLNIITAGIYLCRCSTALLTRAHLISVSLSSSLPPHLTLQRKYLLVGNLNQARNNLRTLTWLQEKLK